MRAREPAARTHACALQVVSSMMTVLLSPRPGCEPGRDRGERQSPDLDDSRSDRQRGWSTADAATALARNSGQRYRGPRYGRCLRTGPARSAAPTASTPASVQLTEKKNEVVPTLSPAASERRSRARR